jgi:hypothetical protein
MRHIRAVHVLSKTLLGKTVYLFDDERWKHFGLQRVFFSLNNKKFYCTIVRYLCFKVAFYKKPNH